MIPYPNLVLPTRTQLFFPSKTLIFYDLSISDASQAAVSPQSNATAATPSASGAGRKHTCLCRINPLSHPIYVYEPSHPSHIFYFFYFFIFLLLFTFICYTAHIHRTHHTHHTHHTRTLYTHRCGEEAHDPCCCAQLAEWALKCRNESETANW
jgi:hypothetical protein